MGGLLTSQDRIVSLHLPDRNLPPGSESVEGNIYAWGTDLLATLAVVAPALAGGGLAGYLVERETWWADLLDDLVQFPAEALTALPGLVLLASILAVVGPSLGGWLAMAFLLPQGLRMARGWWLTAGQQAPWRRLVAMALGFLVLGTGLAVVTQATRGFLGLGVQPPQPNLGAMLREGMQFLRIAPHLVLRPAWALVGTALGWFLLADTLLGKFGFHERTAWLELNR